MILDELQYQKYLLENRSKVFTGDEIQRLKKIFSTPSNYIKKNHDETAVYCFWAYSYLLTIEKFYGKAIDEVSPHLKDSILGRLKNWFVKDYKQLETKETNTKLYKDIESIQDVPSLMKLFERRINQAGRDMERKLLRLFSLKD